MKKIFAVLVLVLFSAVSFAQWGTNGNDIYNTNTGNVGIGMGTSFAPAEKFVIQNNTGQAAIQTERDWAIVGGNAPLGMLRLKNTNTGDLFNFSFRYRNGNHEVIQSAYDATTSNWKEFSYFNFGTGKYEIRNGVQTTEFKTNGPVLFNMADPSNPSTTYGVAIGMGALPIPAGVKLAVGGKVVCKEVEVTLTGMPDYVFKSDYKLRSLYEVENFIKANSHLPEVPSEAEVLANGLNLGDMNAVLLKKVEELTLYMIELKKENDALKIRIENLEK